MSFFHTLLVLLSVISMDTCIVYIRIFILVETNEKIYYSEYFYNIFICLNFHAVRQGEIEEKVNTMAKTKYSIELILINMSARVFERSGMFQRMEHPAHTIAQPYSSNHVNDCTVNNQNILYWLEFYRK